MRGAPFLPGRGRRGAAWQDRRAKPSNQRVSPWATTPSLYSARQARAWSRRRTGSPVGWRVRAEASP
eukprot:11096618-Prorocentrum_lima.AAC.1